MRWAFAETPEVETLRSLTRLLGVPRDYLLVDVETLGFGKAIPIVQVGWGVVNDGQLLNVESLLLNWSDPHYGLDQRWVQEQIGRVTADMAAKNKRYCTTYDRMCVDGVDPSDGMGVLLDLIDSYLEQNQLIVGHNLWMFDRKRINFHCQEFFDCEPKWRPNSVFDTGLVEKAAQLDKYPWTGETREQWYSRVYGGSSKVKWNLESHCVEKYELASRYGIDPSLAHDAGHDCRMTYSLFETYRQISEECLV